MVSDYIRDYLTLRNKKIPNKNKVYAEFKSLYANKKDEAYHQELENIKSLSIHYKKFVNPTTVSDANIKKELGDVLLHIVFYARIASETNESGVAWPTGSSRAPANSPR